MPRITTKPALWVVRSTGLLGAAVGTTSHVVDCPLALLARITDLDEWLALLQAGPGFWKALTQDVAQPCI
jgi:hypothetical protein